VKWYFDSIEEIIIVYIRHTPSASRRVDARRRDHIWQFMHIHQAVNYTSLSITSLTITSLSMDVVWWWSPIATWIFWPFIVIGSRIRSPLIGCMQITWRLLTRVDAVCECLLSLTLVWLDASTRTDAHWRARCERLVMESDRGTFAWACNILQLVYFYASTSKTGSRPKPV